MRPYQNVREEGREGRGREERGWKGKERTERKRKGGEKDSDQTVVLTF